MFVGSTHIKSQEFEAAALNETWLRRSNCRYSRFNPKQPGEVTAKNVEIFCSCSWNMHIGTPRFLYL